MGIAYRISYVLKRQVVMRITSISWIRLVATVMIVLCHYLQAYSNGLAYFFNVGVQVFFLISGFLYGGKEIDFSFDWLKRRFLKIAKPYLVVVAVVAICYLVFDRVDFNGSEFLHALLFSGTMKGMEHLWFVPYILVCYTITPYLHALKRVTGGGIFLVIVLYNVVSILTPFHFHSSDITCYIIGFLMVGRPYDDKRILKRICYLSVPVAILLNVYIIYAKIRLQVDFVNDDFYYWLWAYGHSALGLALFSMMLLFFKDMKENWLTRMSDKYSYEVYLVHHFFLLSPLSLLLLPLPSYCNIILALLAIVLTTIGLKQIEIKLLK